MVRAHEKSPRLVPEKQKATERAASVARGCQSCASVKADEVSCRARTRKCPVTFPSLRPRRPMPSLGPPCPACGAELRQVRSYAHHSQLSRSRVADGRWTVDAWVPL